MASQLPDEILLLILQYLSPYDQLVFSLVCERFRVLSYDRSVVRRVNLSRSSSSHAQDWKRYFGPKERVKNIRALDFSYCFSKSRKIKLDDFIGRCHNLVELHVAFCSFSLLNLCSVLPRLPHLKCLSWSIGSKSSRKFIDPLQSVQHHFKQLTSIYVEVEKHQLCLDILQYFLCYCLHLEEFHINIYNPLAMWEETVYSSQQSRHLQGQSLPDLHLPYLHSLVATIDPCSFNTLLSTTVKSQEILEDIVCKILSSHSPDVKWKKFWLSKELFSLMNSPFDQLMSIQNFEYLETLSCAAEDLNIKKINLLTRIKPSTLKCLLLQRTLLTFQDLELIKQVGGPKLKYLSLFNCVWTPCPEADQLPFSSFFSSCNNITELIISGCHFNIGNSMCAALAHLQSLTRIVLHQCVILSEPCTRVQTEGEDFLYGLKKRKRVVSHPVGAELGSAFMSMVEKCASVTEFHLRGCMHNFSQICRDKDLIPICHWKRLQVLAFEKISYNGNGKFLESITKECSFLETFKLSSNDVIGHSSSFLLSLYSFIKEAPALRHLRILYPLINLNSGLIWHTLCNAERLQHICLQTRFSEPLNVDMVSSIFQKLPQLSALHIHSLIPNKSNALQKLKEKLELMNLQDEVKLIIGDTEVCPSRLKDDMHILEFKQLCQATFSFMWQNRSPI